MLIKDLKELCHVAPHLNCLCYNAVYVIFGATGGIGQDLAKRLLGAKHQVILAANSGEKLGSLKEELGGGETKEVDVMKSKEVPADAMKSKGVFKHECLSVWLLSMNTINPMYRGN